MLRLNGWRGIASLGKWIVILTEVVLTPQSKGGVAGEGAGGVSIHSKFSSDVDLLILLIVFEFCKEECETCGDRKLCQAGTVCSYDAKRT